MEIAGSYLLNSNIDTDFPIALLTAERVVKCLGNAANQCLGVYPLTIIFRLDHHITNLRG